MSSFRNLKVILAAAALIATIGVAGTPAHAALTFNALTTNALTTNGLTAAGSAIGDLNGVAVEAVRRDRIDGVEPEPGDKSGEIALYQLSQVDPGGSSDAPRGRRSHGPRRACNCGAALLGGSADRAAA